MSTTEIAYAASALTCVAVTPALEVFERAVTQGDPGGEVCPSTGGSGFRAFTQHGSDLSAQYGPAAQSNYRRTSSSTRYRAEMGGFSVISNGSLGKPGDGYRVISGTG